MGDAVQQRLRYWLALLACVLLLSLGSQFFNFGIIGQPQQSIDRSLQYLATPDPIDSIKVAMQQPDSAWRSQQSEYLRFPVANTGTWLRFDLQSLSPLANWLLEVGDPALNKIDIWFFSDGQLLATYRTGDHLLFRSRPFATENYLFPLPSEVENPLSVYLYIQGDGAFKVPINLWQESQYIVYVGELNLALGLFLGFMVAMTLSNFFFFLFSRSINFLWYCGYALSVALLLVSLHGLGFKYLWGDSSWMQNHATGIFAASSLLFAVLFMRQLLQLKQNFPRVALGLKSLAGVFLFCMFMAAFKLPALFTNVFLVGVVLTMFALLGLGFWLWRRGVAMSALYVLAWITLSSTVVFACLEQLGALQLQLTLPYVLMLGASIETILLALLLAQNYSEKSRQLLSAQQVALAQEKQITAAKEEVIATQLKANEDLEYKVQERTLELEVALRELAESNRELAEKNTIDALTGIRNRSYFDKKFLAESRRSRREQTYLSVAMLDIDHFKQVNDEHGHLIGDECLRYVANIISAYLKRPSDEACRYGGEEFALLLPNTDQEGAITILEKVRQHIADYPFIHSAGELNVTVSIGYCSAIVQDTGQAETLLQAADDALYQAKRAGRNQTCYQALASTGIPTTEH